MILAVATSEPSKDLVLVLLFTLFAVAIGTFLWMFRRRPDPSDKACDVCGAEPDEECDPWTHNGV